MSKIYRKGGTTTTFDGKIQASCFFQPHLRAFAPLHCRAKKTHGKERKRRREKGKEGEKKGRKKGKKGKKQEERSKKEQRKEEKERKKANCLAAVFRGACVL